jgi:hypothetical protein
MHHYHPHCSTIRIGTGQCRPNTWHRQTPITRKGIAQVSRNIDTDANERIEIVHFPISSIQNDHVYASKHLKREEDIKERMKKGISQRISLVESPVARTLRVRRRRIVNGVDDYGGMNP